MEGQRATRPPSWVANEKIGALSPLRKNSRLSALAFYVYLVT